nr:XRE family transcriptional regulator [Neokomagataea tanensis]
MGITLEQLADTCGVSAAALSRFERGLLSPSLRNALHIARGLDCDLSELVERATVKIIRSGENLRFFDEETGIERLALARPSSSIEVLRYKVPAKTRSKLFAAHQRGTREIFYMLTGSLEIHTELDDISLNEGDSAIIQVDQEHWFENKKNTVANFIIAISAG